MILVVALAFGAAPLGRLAPDQAALVRRSDMLRDDAFAAWDAGKHAEAVRIALRGLDADRAIWGRWSRDAFEGSRHVAGWRERLGEWDSAVALRREALAVAERLLGPTHWEAIDARWALADARRTPAKRAEILRLRDANARLLDDPRVPAATTPEAARALLARWNLLVGERHPGHITALYSLGVVHDERGEYAESAAAYRRALPVAGQVFGERHPRYLALLNNLSASLTYLGSYRDALAAGAMAHAGRAALFGPEHADVALSLHNLAGLYGEMGDPRTGAALAARAFSIRRHLFGEKSAPAIASLYTLAGLHARGDDLDEALRLQRQALRLTREGPGTRHPLYALNLDGLASILLLRGDAKEALALHAESLALIRKARGPSHPEYANALNNLAVASHALAAPDAAALTLEAHGLVTRTHGPLHPLYASASNNLAAVYQSLGRADAAILLAERSLRSARERLALAASAQSERAHRDALAETLPILHLCLSLPDPDHARTHGHVLAWKGAAFMGHRRRLYARLAREGDAAARAAAAELTRVTGELASAAMRPGAKARELADGLASRKAALEEELALAGPDLRLALRPPTSAALAAALPDGVALVDYFIWRPSEARGKPAPLRLSAWVVRKGRPAARVELGEAAAPAARLAAWLAAIRAGRPEGDHPGALRAAVWAPLEKHLGGSKVVLVSPDQGMGAMPFAALPGKTPGVRLIEEAALAIVPVPRLLPELVRPAGGAAALLAVGGVDFGDGAMWADLPGTDAEAASVLAGFKGKAVRLSGASATKAALREALPKARHAHLATHGFFAPPSARSARDAAGLKLHGGSPGWHPELLSGLVLAGANRPPLADDGILTALEVSSLDLSNMDTAVLSACETGLGKGVSAEGILGLQRAFAVAGCRSVVSSLWSVHDAATSVLMERFYLHLWGKKLSKLESLRQAQIDVMRHPEWVEAKAKKLAGLPGLRGVGKASDHVVGGKRERHSPPAWWAAWHLSGDWR